MKLASPFGPTMPLNNVESQSDTLAKARAGSPHARLAAQNMQLVVIALGPRPPDAEARVRELELRFGIYFDPARDAARAFGAHGFPMYFVIDAAGDLRFAYSEPSELLVQASVLAPGYVAHAR